jgi:hypothetical protein
MIFVAFVDLVVAFVCWYQREVQRIFPSPYAYSHTPEDLLSSVPVWNATDLHLIDVALRVAFGNIEGRPELVTV